MAVQQADRELGLRRQAPSSPDAHGDRPGLMWGPLAGPLPGRVMHNGDVPRGEIEGRTAVLALDPALWPVEPNDLVVDGGSGQEWLVTSAVLHENAACDVVDYVRVEAHQRTSEGTRP